MGFYSKTGPTDDDYVQCDDDQTLTNQWLQFGSRVAIRIAIHPLEYAKVLIQVKDIDLFM